MTDKHGSLTGFQGKETTAPLQQMAAAALCYTGVISAAEARELAGFPPEDSGNEHARNMRILARFMRDTGRAIPPPLANWWPGSG